jgi:glyoxylase-like metal-dependent hydrolase (beta-lactamase superfamily II)
MAVVLTHAHVDHITGVGKVVEEWGTPVYLHPQDRSIYDALPEWGYWFGLTCDPAPPPTHVLKDGQTLSLDCLQIRVHHTPGHSPGSVSLQLDNHLFSGDTVFQGSIGRTDLPSASYDVLIETIRNRILPLGDDVVLYPGHGPVTTVGEERLHNPFLTGAARPAGF